MRPGYDKEGNTIVKENLKTSVTALIVTSDIVKI